MRLSVGECNYGQTGNMIDAHGRSQPDLSCNLLEIVWLFALVTAKIPAPGLLNSRNLMISNDLWSIFWAIFVGLWFYSLCSYFLDPFFDPSPISRSLKFVLGNLSGRIPVLSVPTEPDNLVRMAFKFGAYTALSDAKLIKWIRCKDA